MLVTILILGSLNTAILALLLTIKLRDILLAPDPFKLRKPSTELLDFISDIKRRGYGVLRIDPENVLYRSPRDQ